MKILVLTESAQPELNAAIIKRGHTADYINPRSLNLYISDNQKGYDSVFNEMEKIKRTDYDCVISRIGSHRHYATKIVEHFQNNLNVFCTQTADAINTVSDKFTTAQILSQNKIRTPKQFYAANPKNLNFIVKKCGDLPLILKPNSSSKGKGIILLESPLQTNLTLESFYRSGQEIIIQQYINNGRNADERHIFADGKVVSSMERTAPKTDVRANLSIDGTGKKIEPDDETKDIVLRSVSAIPGLNFAGVDVMRDADGKPYVIEINSNPGTKIIDVTGYNHFIDLVRFCENNYKRGGEGTNSPFTNDNAKVWVTPISKEIEIDGVHEMVFTQNTFGKFTCINQMKGKSKL